MSLSGVRVTAREHERKRRRSIHTEWSPKESQQALPETAALRASTSWEQVAGMPMSRLEPLHNNSDDREYACCGGHGPAGRKRDGPF